MAAPNSLRLRRHEHLRRPADFRLVFDHRQSAADEWLIIYVRENGLDHSRLGMSVSRKFGSAVERNRLRRLIREAFRLTRHEAPVGFDLVVVPRKRQCPDWEILQQSFPRLIQKAARNRRPQQR